MRKLMTCILLLAISCTPASAKPFYKNWKFYAAVGAAVAISAVAAPHIHLGQPAIPVSQPTYPILKSPAIPSIGAR